MCPHAPRVAIRTPLLLIVHVRDISHPDSDAQRADVEEVLKEIGADKAVRIEAWNKIDALAKAEADAIRAEAARREDVAVISALVEGCSTQTLQT